MIVDVPPTLIFGLIVTVDVLAPVRTTLLFDATQLYVGEATLVTVALTVVPSELFVQIATLSLETMTDGSDVDV